MKYAIAAAFSYPSCVSSPPSGHMAALSLADHLDMARPAHEAPGAILIDASQSAHNAGMPGAVRRQAVALPIHQIQQQHHRRRVVTGGNMHPAHSASSAPTSLLSRSLPNHATNGVSIAAHSATVLLTQA